MLHFVRVLQLKKLIIILGRENLQKDSNFYQKIIKTLEKKGYTITFDPSDELSSIHAKVKIFGKKLPIGHKLAESIYAKWLKLKFHITYKSYNNSYFKLHKPTYRDFEFRKEILSHYLNQLPKNKEIYMIGRSAGAILATQLADTFHVKKVICLGYPFKHPEKEHEPYRTAHLAHLKTPTIIFQGEHDIYGNTKMAKTFSLSSSITLVSIDTDHEYNCTDEAFELIQKSI